MSAPFGLASSPNMGAMAISAGTAAAGGRSVRSRSVLLATALAVVSLTACSTGTTSSGNAAAPTMNPSLAHGAGLGASGASDHGGAEYLALARFDGSNATLADYRGRPLVVNFFASWCAPCVQEMSDFEQVHREFGDRVAFLGVNVRDRLEDGRSIAAQTGVSYDLARDPRGDLLTRLGGAAMPTTALFDPQGRLVSLQSRSYDADGLRTAIKKKLLA